MKKILLAGICSFLFVRALCAQDPPSRVARLNYIDGNVGMQPAGVNDWAPAELNRPFTIGDYLYTDSGARAELHTDVAVMRMGQNTSFGFLNLNDQTVQIKLTQGDMYFRLRNFSPDQAFEVDTPNAAVMLLREGVYRFRVDPNGNMSFVVVRQGQAEISGGGKAFTLNPGNSAMLTGADELSFDVEIAPAPDDFDNWCAQRDAREARLASARYLPPNVIGYEDLDDYGAWESAPEYGPVWYPRSVVVGWAPYHYGHWAWVEPWGWTWVDEAPWGFAPFHYGRWVFVAGRWGWAPGPIVVVEHRPPIIRPVYAPALVAWFGGAHWGASVSIGGAGVGWVPLGFGEVYTPSYHCSPHYFNNVNVANTTVVKNVNITNVYNTVYVNKTVYNQTFVNMRAPNAVAAMPQNAFASGRPVRQMGMTVPATQAARLQPAAVLAPPVAPTRQALIAAPVVNRPVARPPDRVLQRQVVARNTPAAVPAPFAARQAYLQQNAGQPHDFQAMHRAIAPQPAPAASVRPLAPVNSARTQPVPAARPQTATPYPSQQPGSQQPGGQRYAERPNPSQQRFPQPAQTQREVHAPPARVQPTQPQYPERSFERSQPKPEERKPVSRQPEEYRPAPPQPREERRATPPPQERNAAPPQPREPEQHHEAAPPHAQQEQHKPAPQPEHKQPPDKDKDRKDHDK